MAFPAVRNTEQSSKATIGEPMVVTLPAHETGDLLLIVLRQGTTSTGGVNDYGTPSGWTSFSSNQRIFAKIAASSSETNPSFTGGNDARRAHAVAYSISGVDGSTVASVIELSEDASSSSPALTPSFGSRDYLWIAGFTISNRETTYTTPTDYGNVVQNNIAGASSTAFSAVITARRAFTGTTQTPGAWSPSRGTGAGAFTIAIKGTSSGPGDPPQGTTTISAVDPDITTAEVTYSYDDNDEDSFEYRINEGTAAAIGASPATITGLTANTAYNSPGIQVRAVNANGAGTWSTAQSFTTDAEPLDPPEDAPGSPTALAQSDTVIRLAWTAVTGATGYEVRIDGGSWTDVGNVLTWDATGLTPETEYDFEVRAYNGEGAGPATSVFSETTNATPPETGLYLEFSLDNYIGVPLVSFALPRICVGTATSYSTVTAFFDDVVTSSSGVILLDLGTESGLTAGQWVWIWSAESIGTPGAAGFENNGFIIRREVLSAE
jgi:hypothetical protein